MSKGGYFLLHFEIYNRHPALRPHSNPGSGNFQFSIKEFLCPILTQPKRPTVTAIPGATARKRNTFPRLIAWEVTRSCVLNCVHCRAAAKYGPYPGELDTEACYRFLDDVKSFSDPIIILTGGEPMMRPDIYDIAKYGTKLGLRMVMAPCGLLVTEELAQKIKDSGIMRVSLSIDGLDAKKPQRVPPRGRRLRGRDEGHRELQEGRHGVPGEHDHHEAQREGPAEAPGDGDRPRGRRLPSLPARSHGPRQGT